MNLCKAATVTAHWFRFLPSEPGSADTEYRPQDIAEKFSPRAKLASIVAVTAHCGHDQFPASRPGLAGFPVVRFWVDHAFNVFRRARCRRPNGRWEISSCRGSERGCKNERYR